MYTITFPIAVYELSPRKVLVFLPLARDLLAHARNVPALRIVCPRAKSPDMIADPVEIDLDEHPSLSFRFLPWSGDTRTLPLKALAIRSILTEEAQRSDVWHSCCSCDLWDINTMSYTIGEKHAKGARILCLDSDPASMLESSTGLRYRLQSKLVRARYQRWASRSDGTIFVGKGVSDSYGRYARRSVTTNAVWLESGDIASEASTRQKYSDQSEPVRMVLPSRMTPWKGIDDVITALAALSDRSDRSDRLPPFTLDIFGDGDDKPRLVALAAQTKLPIRFLDPVPYGKPFFTTLQSYHIVLAPTRALEETRIVYDAAASGCVMVHSSTSTLESAIGEIAPRFGFAPGDLKSLQEALLKCFASRAQWVDGALSGLQFVKGRTIDEMHKKRVRFVNEVLTQRNGSTLGGPATV